jgi:hypothetical protein
VVSYSGPYQGKKKEGEEGEEGGEEVSDEEEEEEEEVESTDYQKQQRKMQAAMAVGNDDQGEDSEGLADNSCQLLWQGIQAKRTFTGFKFQECRSLSIARKFLDSKGVVHYWDMAFQTSGTD